VRWVVGGHGVVIETDVCFCPLSQVASPLFAVGAPSLLVLPFSRSGGRDGWRGGARSRAVDCRDSVCRLGRLLLAMLRDCGVCAGVLVVSGFGLAGDLVVAVVGCIRPY